MCVEFAPPPPLLDTCGRLLSNFAVFAAAVSPHIRLWTIKIFLPPFLPSVLICEKDTSLSPHLQLPVFWCRRAWEWSYLRVICTFVFPHAQVYYWQYDPPSSSTYLIGFAVGKLWLTVMQCTHVHHAPYCFSLFLWVTVKGVGNQLYSIPALWSSQCAALVHHANTCHPHTLVLQPEFLPINFHIPLWCILTLCRLHSFTIVGWAQDVLYSTRCIVYGHQSRAGSHVQQSCAAVPLFRPTHGHHNGWRWGK